MDQWRKWSVHNRGVIPVDPDGEGEVENTKIPESFIKVCQEKYFLSIVVSTVESEWRNICCQCYCCFTDEFLCFLMWQPEVIHEGDSDEGKHVFLSRPDLILSLHACGEEAYVAPCLCQTLATLRLLFPIRYVLWAAGIIHPHFQNSTCAHWVLPTPSPDLSGASTSSYRCVWRATCEHGLW